MTLLAGVQADTIVDWYGCGGEYEQTDTGGDGCIDISGWKSDDLCGILVPPPGTDVCQFYTAEGCNPESGTYSCSVASGQCNAGPWASIVSYRCSVS